MYCCFIGHRLILLTSEIIKRLTKFIESLIVNKKVYNYIFGSKSEFNDVCYNIVFKLKQKYPFINLIGCLCKSEAQIYCVDKKEVEASYFNATKKHIKVNAFDSFLNLNNNYVAGKASYIERNQLMIDNSDICVFYYNQNLERKSGTKYAYNYAKKKNKQIYNLFNEQKK